MIRIPVVSRMMNHFKTCIVFVKQKKNDSVVEKEEFLHEWAISILQFPRSRKFLLIWMWKRYTFSTQKLPPPLRNCHWFCDFHRIHATVSTSTSISSSSSGFHSCRCNGKFSNQSLPLFLLPPPAALQLPHPLHLLISLYYYRCNGAFSNQPCPLFLLPATSLVPVLGLVFSFRFFHFHQIHLPLSLPYPTITPRLLPHGNTFYFSTSTDASAYNGTSTSPHLT